MLVMYSPKQPRPLAMLALPEPTKIWTLPPSASHALMDPLPERVLLTVRSAQPVATCTPVAPRALHVPLVMCP